MKTPIRTTIGRALNALPASALLALALAALPATLAPPAAEAATQVPAARSRLSVDVWINKEEGGVFTSGEKMQVFFRASQDAYVLIYNIDTEGYIHLIYPFRPSDPSRVEAGATYRVPSRHDPYDLVAEGPEGMEYIVALASPFPFQDLPWFLAPGSTEDSRARDDQGDANAEDDLDQGVIVGDPYVGMEKLNSRLVPNGREDQVATADTYFYLGRRVDYPRYVCADCHQRTYWFDPYVDYCSVVDIRIDATWARYAPIRFGAARPRYYYQVRSNAPTRYRAWKERWSSLDGNKTLRDRFVLEREVRDRRLRDGAQRRQTPPEFKDLRRYRPGRLWQGRDQVIPLRDRRDGAVDKIRERIEQRRQQEPDRNRDQGNIRDRRDPGSRGQGQGQGQGQQGQGQGRERDRGDRQSPPPEQRQPEQRQRPDRQDRQDRPDRPDRQDRQEKPQDRSDQRGRSQDQDRSQDRSQDRDRSDRQQDQSQGRDSRDRGR